MKLVKATVAAAAAVFVILFIAQNIDVLREPVVFRLNLGFVPPLESYPLPFGGYVLLAFLAGYFLAFFITAGERYRIRREMKKIKREEKSRRTEITAVSSPENKSQGEKSERKFDG